MAPDILLMTAAVFVAVGLAAATGTTWLLERNAPERRRLRAILGTYVPTGIAKASQELAIAHPALAEELRFITTEIRAGKPRAEAFANFGKRTGLDEVRALVSMLNQTDRFGTSVAQALRTHAETSRTKRR